MTALKRTQRRGTTAEHGSFTGAAGEITVDMTKDTAVVHDGTTAGGHPLAKASDLPLANATVAQIQWLTNGAYPVTTAGILGAVEMATPSGASNFAPNWGAFITADWNLTGNRTLSNPTNVIPGTTRYVVVRGSTATAHTVTFGTSYKGALPTIADVTSTKWYLLSLVAYSSTHIIVGSVEALS